MGRRSYIVGLLGALALIGCGGPKQVAKAPETDPWADYKGTYAPGGAADKPEPKAAAAAEPKTAAAEPKRAAASPTESKPATAGKPKKAVAEPKIAAEPKTAAAEPKTVAAESKPATLARSDEPKPAVAPTDARAIYGVETSASTAAAPAPEETALAPIKKATKKGAKKGAAGKKGAGKKPAPATQ